jgi:hypothetical protein
MPSIRLDEGLSLHRCRPAIAKRHQLFMLFWITEPVWRGSRERPLLTAPETTYSGSLKIVADSLPSAETGFETGEPPAELRSN